MSDQPIGLKAQVIQCVFWCVILNGSFHQKKKNGVDFLPISTNNIMDVCQMKPWYKTSNFTLVKESENHPRFFVENSQNKCYLFNVLPNFLSIFVKNVRVIIILLNFTIYVKMDEKH